MVDSPYYRPPGDDAREPDLERPAPVPRTAIGRPPMPFGEVDRAPNPGPGSASAHQEPERPSGSGDEPDDPGDPAEELWAVVATLLDPAPAHELAAALEEAGIEPWVRATNEYGLSTGLTRAYEVLVPDGEEDRARPIVDDIEAGWADLAEFSRTERQDSGDGCRRFVFFGGIGLIVVIAVLVLLVLLTA